MMIDIFKDLFADVPRECIECNHRTTKWLADHDKQVRNEVIEDTFKVLNQALRDLGQDTIPRFILDGVAEQLKGGGGSRMSDIKIVLPINEKEYIRDCQLMYDKGRADEKRENEQDAYHRGYLDGQAKCSFDNERKIRADERERIKEAIYDFISDEIGKYTGDDRYIVEEWRKELMKINKRLGEIVRGEK